MSANLEEKSGSCGEDCRDVGSTSFDMEGGVGVTRAVLDKECPPDAVRVTGDNGSVDCGATRADKGIADLIDEDAVAATAMLSKCLGGTELPVAGGVCTGGGLGICIR
jgi:hypothetical protein